MQNTYLSIKPFTFLLHCKTKIFHSNTNYPPFPFVRGLGAPESFRGHSYSYLGFRTQRISAEASSSRMLTQAGHQPQ